MITLSFVDDDTQLFDGIYPGEPFFFNEKMGSHTKKAEKTLKAFDWDANQTRKMRKSHVHETV